MKKKLPKRVIIRSEQYYSNFMYKRKQYRYPVGSIREISSKEASNKVEELRSKVRLGLFESERENDKKDFIRLNKIIDHYLDYCKNNIKHYKKRESHLRQVIKYFKNIFIKELDLKLTEKFKADLKDRGLSPNTINYYLGDLKRAIEHAVDLELIDKNPIKKSKNLRVYKKQFNYIDSNQFDILYENATRHLKFIILGAYLTGMRKSEMLNLKWEDIDFKKKEILVLNTKNKENRIIPINDKLFEALEIRFKNKKSDYVFVNDEGEEYIDEGAWKNTWTKCRKVSNLSNIVFHDFRRTFITNLLIEHGEEYSTVMSITGHKDIQTLLGYVTYIKSELKHKAVNKLSKQAENIDLNKL